jgi:hypothetical protein
MSSSPNSKRKKYAHHAEFYLYQVDRCTRLAEDATEQCKRDSLEAERHSWLQVLAGEIGTDEVVLDAAIALVPMDGPV